MLCVAVASTGVCFLRTAVVHSSHAQSDDISVCAGVTGFCAISSEQQPTGAGAVLEHVSFFRRAEAMHRYIVILVQYVCQRGFHLGGSELRETDDAVLGVGRQVAEVPADM